MDLLNGNLDDIHLKELNIVNSVNNLENLNNTRLKNIKSKLDYDLIKKNWDKWKKLGNEYELIFCSNNKYNQNKSISIYNPVSRSFFKLIEMMNYFNLLKNNNNKLNILCLAEGPGGFIEALHYKRKQYNDFLIGITIQPYNNNIPNWNKLNNKIKNLNLIYANIFNLNNIKDKIKLYTDKKFDFITSDGGIDYSNNYNNQELDSYKIIYCEIILALLFQNINGTFICKIFDIFSDFTKKLIYILTIYYDNVYIYKPKTSRVANSEKYIICKNFKGINENILNKLIILNDKIEINNNNYLDITGIKISELFINKLNKYTNNIINNQIRSIELILKYIYLNPTKVEYNKIIIEQVRLAVMWCNNNNININKNSIYFKKYITY